MKLILSAAARIALRQVRDWIAKDNPARALSFVIELEARCATLLQNPRAFPLLPRHEDSGIRRCPFRGYLIFYHVTKDAVEVVEILHGARDYESLLFPTDDP